MVLQISSPWSPLQLAGGCDSKSFNSFVILRGATVYLLVGIMLWFVFF